MSETHIPAALRRLVRDRAGHCCEYCRIPESVTLTTHAIDHVIAEKHGGPTVAENLALSCAICNMHKGSDLASVDPLTGEIVLLFHPRRDRWSEHFRLMDGRVEPLTPTGRVTARLLQLNSPPRVEERALLVAAGMIRLPVA
ncbi:MAG TPA: HNH endonuclease signature motif containing protein [Gemmataceae bacterium]|nr:HNH endonuclease signature motif containing protein [Gemmataceae bacterium]